MWEGVSAWAVGGDVARAFGHVQAGGDARVRGVSLCARTHSHSSCTRTQAAGRVSWGHGDNIHRWAKFDTLSGAEHHSSPHYKNIFLTGSAQLSLSRFSHLLIFPTKHPSYIFYKSVCGTWRIGRELIFVTLGIH